MDWKAREELFEQLRREYQFGIGTACAKHAAGTRSAGGWADCADSPGEDRATRRRQPGSGRRRDASGRRTPRTSALQPGAATGSGRPSRRDHRPRRHQARAAMSTLALRRSQPIACSTALKGSARALRASISARPRRIWVRATSARRPGLGQQALIMLRLRPAARRADEFVEHVDGEVGRSGVGASILREFSNLNG